MKQAEFSKILSDILSNLHSLSSDIEACAVISNDGLIMASNMQNGLDEDIVAAMATALSAQGGRVVRELKLGSLQQLLIKAQQGYVLINHAGRQAILMVMVKNNAKLGFIFLGAKKAAEQIRQSGIHKPNTRIGLVYLKTG